jgi:type II secretory pathway pseudopilin PulG
MAAEPARAIRGTAPQQRQDGLVLIALLLMLMLVGVGALAAAEVWSTARKREREVQLLWVGDQYRRAVESYWRATPGARKVLPSSITQLLNDDRFPNPVHHLRQAYRDPMAEDVDFEPVVINNALVGVHSTSKEAPMKHAHFPRRYTQFADAEDYSQWQFVFIPPTRRYSPAPAVTPGPPPGLPGARH